MHGDTVPKIYQIQSQTSKQPMKMIELEFIDLVLLRRIQFDKVHFLCRFLSKQIAHLCTHCSHLRKFKVIHWQLHNIFLLNVKSMIYDVAILDSTKS